VRPRTRSEDSPRRCGLPASVGAGSGKQLAKIASELAKPDGLRVVGPAEEREVLAPLPVRALWGVGPVAEAALHRLGVRTIGALAALDLREVTAVLGVAIGTELHRLARGVDDRPVAPRGAAKQVSAETTFDADLTAMTAVHEAVARITESAHRRLVSSGRAARTVTVKVRSADFTTHTRSATAGLATTDLAALTAVAQRLARTAVPEGGVRLIGVSLAGLGEEPPPGLFDDTGPAEGDVLVPFDRHESAVDPGEGAAAPTEASRSWRAGDDVTHPEFGHGWVQGAGHGRVTVRFETRTTGPGRARTLAADDPSLSSADPAGSLA
jgi:DNA polymerase-4